MLLLKSLTNKKLILFFLISVIFFSYSVSAAEIVDSGFVGYTNRATSLYNTSVCTPVAFASSAPTCIEFEDISQFGTNIKEIHGYIPYSNVGAHSSVNSDYNLSVQIKAGTLSQGSVSHPDEYPIVGSGMCFYSKSDDTQKYFLSLYIEDLYGLEGASGDYFFYIEGIDFHGLKIKTYNGVNWESSDPNWFVWGCWDPDIPSNVRPGAEGTETRLVSYMSFQNAYYAYDNYILNVNKTIGGTSYYSKVKIEDGNNGIILNETTLSSTDIWVSVQDSENGTTIYYEDSLGDIYTSYPSFTSTIEDDGVPNTLSGTVVCAKDNTLLDGVNINLTTKTGYGGDYQDTSSLGFYEITGITDDNYNLTANYTSFEPYQRDLELSEDLTLTIPLIPTDSVTLGMNLSGIYGIVSDYYTEQPIPNAIVRIENSTYSDFTSTNNNGYYEFVNVTVGNYTVEANKVEYYPYQQKNLTTTPNDMLVHNFDMVLLVEPVETVSDELEDALGLDEVTEEDILHFFKIYGFWLFILALIFFMYAAYKSSGIDRWF